MLQTGVEAMSTYPQFGYSYPSPSQLLVAGQPTTVAGGNAPSTASSCCENGRPIMTDPVSGQTVCSCQYDSARLALSSYPRLSTSGVGLGTSMYGAPYPSTDQNPYPSIGMDSSAFYSPLGNPYSLKDSSASADMSAWTSASLQPTTGYYPYDPALAAYGYGAGYDLAARRKNATRESTATLKAWLSEHKKNPYPTKGEKIMLAIITKMTLTQVSTWFANARRRLKKENKMTWEPKNKPDDDDDAILSDTEEEKEKDEKEEETRMKEGKEVDDLKDNDVKKEPLSDILEKSPSSTPNPLSHFTVLPTTTITDIISKEQKSTANCGIPLPASKPKIWSLADTAACKTPPPTTQSQPWLNSLSNFTFPASVTPNTGYNRYSSSILSGNPSGYSLNGINSTSMSVTTPSSSGGYPEVQTDTPPQTPPNMKLPSVAGSLLTSNVGFASSSLGYGSGPGLASNSRLHQSHSPQSSTLSQNLSHNHSERKELVYQATMLTGQSHAESTLASQTHAESTAFKPVYRSSQPAINFVPPV